MLLKGRDFFDEPISEVFPSSTRPYGRPSLIQNLHGTSRGTARKTTPQSSKQYHSGEHFQLESRALDQTTHEFLNEQMRIWGRGKGASSSSKPRQLETPTRMSIRAESPKGTKPAKKSKVFRFIRRPLRKPKNEELPEIHEPNATIPTQEAPRLTDKPEIITPPRPSTASRVLSRTSSKVSKKSKFLEVQDQLEEIPESTSNPAYIPKHAASDFSQMKLSSKSSSIDDTQESSTQEKSVPGPHSSDPSTMQSTPSEPVEENNDYQIFLAQARAAAAASYNDRGVISPNVVPRTACAMNNIYANHQEIQLKRAKSTPQRQRSQRVSGGSAVLEKVGEYVRPSAIKQIHREGSAATRSPDGQELPGLGFSAVSDTIRRSLSTKRKDGYGRPRAGSEAGERPARNRTMPPNAAMQKLKEKKEEKVLKVWPPGY